MWMDGWTDSSTQLDRQTHEEMAKLTVALRNFVNASKNIPCTCGCHMKLYIKNLAQSLLFHCDVLVMTMKHAYLKSSHILISSVFVSFLKFHPDIYV